MRVIGHLDSEAVAVRFGDFLYVNGIRNEVEHEREGAWAIWVYEEEEMERARQLLAYFLKEPGSTQFLEASERAREQREAEEDQGEAAARRYHTREEIFAAEQPYRAGRLTLGLIGVSVMVAVLSGMGENRAFLSGWFMSWPAVMNGEVWRLLTPIFIHFGPLHIIFNMLWLYDLGGIMETKLGTARFAIMVLVLGILSNLGQYFGTGANFGGMSGVVYGLLGYIWIRGKFDPGSGFFLHPTTVALMIIWFFLGVFGMMSMANIAHGAGLGIGMAWGFVAANANRR